MSVANLSEHSGRRAALTSRVSSPEVDQRNVGETRARIRSLVDTLQSDELDVVAEMLAAVTSRHDAGPRNFTGAEVAGLEALGVAEAMLEDAPSTAARGRTALSERVFERDALSAAEVALILGVSAARVRQRAAEGSLIARRTRAGWGFPALQFPDRRELPGWSIVARAFPPGTSLLLVDRILTRPAARLVDGGDELTPIEWLRHGGDPELAADAIDDALHRLP